MNEPQWTINALKSYFDTAIAALEKHFESIVAANDERYNQRFVDSQTAVQAALSAASTAVAAALSAAKEAVAKAEVASGQRFTNVDAVQATITEQLRLLLLRTEADARFASMDDRVKKLESADDLERGTRSGSRDVWAWIVAGAGVLFGLVSIFLNYFKGDLKP